MKRNEAQLSNDSKRGGRIEFVAQVVCTFLYQEPVPFLPQIERWTRKALQLAPGAQSRRA
jgi:hypothetical protein